MSDRLAAGLASRRELLGGALAGAAATTLAAPAALAAPGASAADAVSRDERLLRRLLAIERRISATYRRVLASGVLSVVVAAEISGFLDQEQQHIGALERELALRGSPVPGAAPLHPSGRPETQADGLILLMDVEIMAENAYFGAVSKFADPSLVTVATEILASEAQHWTLLRAIQSPDNLAAAAPSAYVTGST